MIANHKGEIPFVVLIIPYLIGIGLGYSWLATANTYWLYIAFFLLSAVFIVLNLLYKRLKLYKWNWLGGSLITLLLFLFGWLTTVNYKELNNGNHFTKIPAKYLVVKINNEPIFKNGLRFTAEVEKCINYGKKSSVSGTLLIATKDSSAKNLYYGDELIIQAKYNPIDPPFVPAEFNYKQYLANQNIFYQAFLTPKQFAVLNRNTGNQLIAFSLRLRQRLVEKLKQNMRDTNAVAVASTLILGYKADLSNDVLQAYSKTGTIHVLSVSGAHVAIIYILLALMLGFLDKYKHGKLIKAILIILIIWYYSLLSGFSPAVCRSAVMISMVIIGKTYNRYINTLNIMAISAFMLLLYDPLFITDVGFQLSYLAVCGLIVFQPIVYQLFKLKNKWADKLWAFCSVSIAAQVITFPLSAFYFHQFPVYFLVSNLFIIIPTSIIMYAGLFFLLLPPIPFISGFAAFVLEKSILLMNNGLAFIEHSPYASVGKIWLTIPEYLLLYIIIISLFYFLYDKKSWLLKVCLAATLLLCISLSAKRIHQTQTKSIAWLNLKKHYGIVFKNGNEAIILSDVKPADKTWQYSIQPYLDSCQVNDFHCYNLNEDTKTPWFAKRQGLIQFLNDRVFVVSGQIPNILMQKKLKTNYIYITGNPDISLAAINVNFDYSMLVVNGDNSDNLIDEIKKDAKKTGIKYVILKRNNSIISVSN